MLLEMAVDDVQAAEVPSSSDTPKRSGGGIWKSATEDILELPLERAADGI
jgi:hypothetical protein